MKRHILFCALILFMAGMFAAAAASTVDAAATASEAPGGFCGDYAALIQAAGEDIMPGLHAHVSLPENGADALAEAGSTLETLEKLNLEITVRLVFEGETIDMEALHALYEKLAGLGYYGGYSCCAVSNADRACEMIKTQADPEEAMFMANVMRQNASFGILKNMPAEMSLAEMEAGVLGISYEVATGVTVKPFDVYALDMRIKDAAEYEKYFDFADRLTPVYAFASIGKCRVGIDLAALGLEDADFEVYTLEWDAQALSLRPVKMNYVYAMDKIYLAHVPAYPFCLMKAEVSV